METFLEFSSKADKNISEETINDVYFFKNTMERDNVKKTIAVNFADKKSKDKMMMSKTKLRKSDDNKRNFVNDYFTTETFKPI